MTRWTQADVDDAVRRTKQATDRLWSKDTTPPRFPGLPSRKIPLPPVQTPRPVGDVAVAIDLPWPPSVNHYWQHVRKNVIVSDAGKHYRCAAVAAVFAQQAHQRLLDGRLAFVVLAYPPDRRRRDLDNILKASLDALTFAGVIADDSNIDDLRVIRSSIDGCGNGKLSVLIREIEHVDA